IIGVALSSNFVADLGLRVLWDNMSKGQVTPKIARYYKLLKGKSFRQLDCHSNGAMVCLAAIANGDLKAKEVRLLGPQITPAALREWQRLAREKNMRVTIYYNNRDPVPWVSNEAGSVQIIGPPLQIANTIADGISRAVRKASAGKGMQKTIKMYAPLIKVVRFRCSKQGAGAFIKLECHGLDQYRAFLR
ncbi:MAG: hypothetical protein O7G83_12475, partial [Proteobacteria bacterium]|nr:hypothetical protein [Pseudomonadota bacterium]